MTWGESKSAVSSHHHIKDMFIFNSLLVYDNCYGISCHTKVCKNSWHITSEMCYRADAHFYHHPPFTMVMCIHHGMITQAVHSSANSQSDCPTLDTSHLKMWQNCHSYLAILDRKPREFSTRTSKIYEIFFAVTQETTCAEDHVKQQLKLILSSIRF